MTNFKLFLVFTILNCSLFVWCKLSDKRLCANDDCTEIIAKAKTLTTYHRGEEGMLSFPPSAELNIYSEAAGSNSKIVGVEYKGVRGYVPKDLIRVEEVYVKKDALKLVNTEFFKSKEVPLPGGVKPSKVETEIVDGTTIYNDFIIDPSTPQQISSTSTPQGKLENNVVPNYMSQPVIENIESKSLGKQDLLNTEEKNASIEEKGSPEKLEATQKVEITDRNIEEKGSPEKLEETQKVEITDKNIIFNNNNELKDNPVENIANSNLERENFLKDSSLNNLIKKGDDEKKHLEVIDTEKSDKIVLIPSDPSTTVYPIVEEITKNNTEENKQLETETKLSQDKIDDLTNFVDTTKGSNLLVNTKENNVVNINILDQKPASIVEDKDLSSKSGTNQIEETTNKVDENKVVEPLSKIEEYSSKNESQEMLMNEQKIQEEIPKFDSINDGLENIKRDDLKTQIVEDKINDETHKFVSINGLETIKKEDLPTQMVNEKIHPEESATVFDHIPTAKPFAMFKNAFANTKNNKPNLNPTEQAVNHDASILNIPENTETKIDENSKIDTNDYMEDKTTPSGDFVPSWPNDIDLNEEFKEKNDDILMSKLQDQLPCSDDPNQEFCTINEKNSEFINSIKPDDQSDFAIFNFINEYQQFLLLITISGISIVIFLWGYMLIDKMKKVAPLIAKINNLEKSLIISKKENEILTEKMSTIKTDINTKDQIDSQNYEVILELKSSLDEAVGSKIALEEQVQILEKELENSAEVGLELNRMLSEVLSSQNGNETVLDNIEQLQKQLVDQQCTINTINAKLNEKEAENYELQMEVEINGKKVVDLQVELDKMTENFIKIEEEKQSLINKYNDEISEYKIRLEKIENTFSSEKNQLVLQIEEINNKLNNNQRSLELKIKEYNLLREATQNSSTNSEQFESLLNNNSLKAELQQLQADNKTLNENFNQNKEIIKNYETQLASIKANIDNLKQKYEIADREKLEAFTKLDVLGAYFKEKEAELQKELSKHETMWSEKQGETSTATERIKFLQGEVQNFKSQYESLKQELISQEVEYKSQISVLDKKAHENWVAARQAERKFEDARQEAAQLRNRLTLRERNINEDKLQNRIPLPLETNGDIPMSPLHMNDSAASPPLLFAGGRDHLTTSPPLPGMHPLLPPPPGMPFMPPPIHGLPPFMPPPPGGMFPGDHRPPPLGRMSSPPINRRYSPDLDSYHYDRNSPSPTDDEYYDHPRGGYSPYNGRERDRRDYNRPPPPMRNVIRNHKGTISSGSANSNESLENINRHNSKV